jgi:exosortase A-associated hydrolase 2
MAAPRHASADTFFLAGPRGERYCAYHAPHGPCRGALVYVHPFAEEMNKSRRMAALQARALAALGYGVLQIDLHGCGDSDGDFADARWEHWKDDIDAARTWLAQRLGRHAGVWGLRLGALLALDYARTAQQPVAQLLLWQPVLQGAAFMTQFLRLRVAGAMLDEAAEAAGGTRALRAALQAGTALEIAGYVLTPELVAAIDGADALKLVPPCPVHWIEIGAGAARPVPPAAQRVALAWESQGCTLLLQQVVAPSFWATQEIAESAALIGATCALFEGAPHE